MELPSLSPLSPADHSNSVWCGLQLIQLTKITVDSSLPSLPLPILLKKSIEPQPRLATKMMISIPPYLISPPHPLLSLSFTGPSYPQVNLLLVSDLEIILLSLAV